MGESVKGMSDDEGRGVGMRYIELIHWFSSHVECQKGELVL